MAMTDETRLKLAAGIYGDFVTNDEVKNPTAKNSGYKPNLGALNLTHEQWIKDLLSGIAPKIQTALSAVDIQGAQQNDVIAALPTDREVALAVYQKLKHDFAHFKGASGSSSSHDY